MEETKKDTEQLILEAAIKEFSTKGLDGARTSAIAAEAGVTHAMLHYYFRTKEKLFLRIFGDKIREIMRFVVVPLARSGGDLRQRIREGVEAHFDMLLSNRWLPPFVITTMNSHPELVKEFLGGLSESVNEAADSMQSELDQAYEAGKICRVDARKLLGDIASLNALPFVSTPMFMTMAGFKPGQEDEFFAMRREESVQTILKRLAP